MQAHNSAVTSLALALNALLVLWEELYFIAGAVELEYAME